MIAAPPPPRGAQIRAAALLLVLWIIGILSFLLVGLLSVLGDNVTASSAARAETFAWIQAQSGLAIASHPRIRPNDPILRVDPSAFEGFNVTVTSESARPDLNVLLLQEGEPGHRFLEDLFVGWGVEQQTAQIVVEHLADYVDADEDTRLNGAEAAAYEAIGRPGEPPNRPFRTVDEARFVLGVEELERFVPDWRSRFTTYGGPIDIGAADAEIVAAATGSGLYAAESFVAERNGDDGVLNTDDDRPPENMAAALAELGVPQGLVSLTLEGGVVRIESRGWAGDGRVEILQIRRRGSTGDSGLLHHWEGRY